MLKKVITYTNPFTEEEVTEDHYFHISKADLVEMEMEANKSTYKKDGEELTGMQAKLQRIVDSEDGKAIMFEFKDIIRRAYGKKDGDHFLKSKEIWEEFSATEAFSQLIFEVCTDANAASEFINGIIPKNMDKIAAEVRAQQLQTQAEQGSTAPEESSAIATVEKAADAVGSDFPKTDEARVLTNDEVAEMDATELKSGLATGRYKLA